MTPPPTTVVLVFDPFDSFDAAVAWLAARHGPNPLGGRCPACGAPRTRPAHRKADGDCTCNLGDR